MLGDKRGKSVGHAVGELLGCVVRVSLKNVGDEEGVDISAIGGVLKEGIGLLLVVGANMGDLIDF